MEQRNNMNCQEKTLKRRRNLLPATEGGGKQGGGDRELMWQEQSHVLKRATELQA
jgi:hypothetical protein